MGYITLRTKCTYKLPYHSLNYLYINLHLSVHHDCKKSLSMCACVCLLFYFQFPFRIHFITMKSTTMITKRSISCCFLPSIAILFSFHHSVMHIEIVWAALKLWKDRIIMEIQIEIAKPYTWWEKIVAICAFLLNNKIRVELNKSWGLVGSYKVRVAMTMTLNVYIFCICNGKCFWNVPKVLKLEDISEKQITISLK